MMTGPIRSSSRSGIAKALAASPAASPARPASTSAGASSSSKKLVQGTLTASLGLKREPPPFIPPKSKATGAAAASSSKATSEPKQAEAGSSSSAVAPIAPAGPVSDETLAAFHQYFPKLGDDKLPLLQLELETMGRDWLEVLSRDMAKPTFLEVRFRPPIAAHAGERQARPPSLGANLPPTNRHSSPSLSSSASSSTSSARRRFTRRVRPFELGLSRRGERVTDNKRVPDQPRTSTPSRACRSCRTSRSSSSDRSESTGCARLVSCPSDHH